jgi:hypothetical protein
VLGSGKTEVLRITIEPWSDGMKVIVNPRSIIDPEIEDWSASPFWRGVTCAERFAMMQIFVAGEVAIYEYDSTGETRKPEMLTSEFKALSESRRQPASKITEQRAPTMWSHRVAGKLSTRSSFDGGRTRP